MNTEASEHLALGQTDSIARICSILEAQPALEKAAKVCCVPLWLTQNLVGYLLSRFVSTADAEQVWRQLEEFGLLIQRDEKEWRLDQQPRRYFLDRLEQEEPGLAQNVHRAMLDYVRASPLALDKDEAQLQEAYHTTPLDQPAGARLYWSTYCRIRLSNRFAMLGVLANLAESQTRWLKGHDQEISLYSAAAFYHEGSIESKGKAAALLKSILEQGALPPVLMDAAFLQGTLTEQTDRDGAVQLYEEAIRLRDELDLPTQDRDVQHHLRLTLAKCFANLANILQDRVDPKELDKAEEYLGFALQIVSVVTEAEPGYEATQLRRLIDLLQKRGKETERHVRRIGQIEHPFRQAFLQKAQSSKDLGYLYYAISALNHGLGYERQQIRVEVQRDGAAWLEGTYDLRAMSMLSRIDTFLETVPDSKAGVHFQSVQSLVPTFVLGSRPMRGDDAEAERLEIGIDPPMQPGDQLTYRWTAVASPGTFATEREQLKEAKSSCEYVAWDVIAPMKRLEIQVVIPSESTQPPPPTWFELWRVGTWHAEAQAQTAYRASLEEDPSRVRWHVEIRPPDKIQLSLEVNYPFLAMSYVLCWQPA